MTDVAEETYLGYTSTASPLLLWLTVNADWHSGDKHEFAAFLKEFKQPYGGEDDNQTAALYVLGDDGPKQAEFAVALDADATCAGLRIVCSVYDVDVEKTIPNWI